MLDLLRFWVRHPIERNPHPNQLNSQRRCALYLLERNPYPNQLNSQRRCALYRDLFTDLTTLGAPPNPPPPPIAPLDEMDELTPIGIFFSGGVSPNMVQGALAEELVEFPYRRHLQSQDADGEGQEVLDLSDDPLIIDACSNADNLQSLCETNGYENAARCHPLNPFEV